MTFAILMIYLAGTVYTVQILSGFVTFFTIGMLVLLIISLMLDDPDEKTMIKIKKRIKTISIGCAISAFVLIFIPSEKTFYMLAGADVAGQVVDKTSPVLNKTLELIEQKLDEELKGTKQEKQENN